MARILRTHKIICENCGIEKIVTNRYMKGPRFCNKSCSNFWQYKNGVRPAKKVKINLPKDRHQTYEQKFGHEKAELIKAKQRMNCSWTGKSIEERYEFKKSQEIRGLAGLANRGKCRSKETKLNMRNAMIKRLEEKPETINSFGIKGWYKGLFFRSSYEYFFMKKLESDGLSLKEDIKLENFRISYVINNETHVFIPDFFVPKRQTVYEIKNSFSAKSSETVIKTSAAIKFFAEKNISFVIVTDKDLKMPSSKKIRSELENDKCVFLLKHHVENDRWEAMFEQQKIFMNSLQEKRSFPEFPLDFTKKDNQRFIKDIAHDCMHEIFEAIHLLKNAKLHRATEVIEFNKENFLEELVDAQHYLIEIYALMGFSSQEVFNAFMKKGTVNSARIVAGY